MVCTAGSNDLVVNPTKAKQLTNVRASGTDEALILTPPVLHTLEQALEFIDSDELVEVTPEYSSPQEVAPRARAQARIASGLTAAPEHLVMGDIVFHVRSVLCDKPKCFVKTL